MNWVYLFGDGQADGNRESKDVLGGKGANLAEMTQLGLPVPPGFTISTQVCQHFYEHGQQYPESLKDEVQKGIEKIEQWVGAEFGSNKNPLLVSVRSGARVSMPGMMDTILNLGLNDQTVTGLASASQNERFALDAYRRFIQMYSDVVLGIAPHYFERPLAVKKSELGLQSDSELDPTALETLIEEFKQIVRAQTGQAFPTNVHEQLWGAIGAVFGSWQSGRAVSYRKINEIPDNLGTAVNIQAMVFGNMGETSATGVAFTRDPGTGERRFFGEYLVNAQGEDVVAGIRTPLPINEASAVGRHGEGTRTLEETFPEVYSELEELYQKLETHYRDMQDIEFTVQNGKLYLLQTRAGKRAASAAVRIAVEMVNEGTISKEEAISRITTSQIEHLLHPRLDPRAEKKVIAKGLPASPGAASGGVVFFSSDAENLKKQGKRVILVRHETSPEDIAGMDAAEGILTALGGMTSHAAVVARGMGTPCVAGCGAINIDYEKREFRVGETTIREGQILTLDGSSGEVIEGDVPTMNSQVDQYFKELMTWVDEKRKLQVRANAETPNDVKVARQFGAEGVGLCRTEHMFFEEDRIRNVREMILADTLDQRERALDRIFTVQKDDFKNIFREMKGYGVTVRLLDPPLHEFLPRSEDDIKELAQSMELSPEVLRIKVKSLREINPMLGHRGCRLGISYPEIYRMQCRAILEAACELVTEEGFQISPEIMLPFIGALEEFRILKNTMAETCEQVLAEKKVTIPYSIGTMIEIPRAALVADEIAKEADFFSFGTNDLTQMTLGLSRDDAGSFLPKYVEKKIYPKDPFISIDQDGVGKLLQLASKSGRTTRSDLKLGICGEHGGDAASIAFCHALGFDYVSCSPFRVPVARLAAAHAAIQA